MYVRNGEGPTSRMAWALARCHVDRYPSPDILLSFLSNPSPLAIPLSTFLLLGVVVGRQCNVETWVGGPSS